MKKGFVTLILALLSTPLIAQTKAKPIEVVVQQVNDRRTSGSFAQLVIGLALPKIRSSEVAASRVIVATAVDDAGVNLLDPDRGEPQLETNMRGGMMQQQGQEPPPVSVSVTLKNPDRKATQVKEVRGEIELFMPSQDSNSVAEIPRFVSFSGKPLAHRALKANGVEIALVSQAQIDAEKKRLGDVKRKELEEMGFKGEDLETYVTSHLENVLSLEESDVMARIKDPNKRIQEIVYVDAAGETKRVSTSDQEGMTKLSTWGDKPQADWKLRVSMKTPKNTVRHSFVLTNVPLP